MTVQRQVLPLLFPYQCPHLTDWILLLVLQQDIHNCLDCFARTLFGLTALSVTIKSVNMTVKGHKLLVASVHCLSRTMATRKLPCQLQLEVLIWWLRVKMLQQEEGVAEDIWFTLSDGSGKLSLNGMVRLIGKYFNLSKSPDRGFYFIALAILSTGITPF